MARISELGYGCTGAELKIRILRKWIHHYRQTETWFLAVDQHGDAVQILGKKPNQHLLESKLHVQRCYAIEDYTCTQTRNYLKTISNPIHLNLGLASKIKEIEDSVIYPRHWFQFDSIERLQQPANENPDLTDVIGSFKEIRTLHKDDGELFVKLALIHESGNELNITLWNECINSREKFDSDFLNTTATNTIFALTGLKIKDYGGQPSFNSTAATHVYRNPAVPETESLVKRLENNALLPSMILYTPITLLELSNLSYSAAKGKTFGVRATIDRFTFNEGWFSAFCPSCDTPIPKKGNDWFCITHGIPRNVSYSYTLSAMLDDTTHIFLILLSDSVVTKMCGTSSQHIIVELGYDDQSMVPPTIDRCRFGNYVFNIQMTKWSRSDTIQFVAIDVQNETQNVDESSSLLLTPPPAATATPNSVSKSNIIKPADNQSSTRKQIVFEDEEETLATEKPLKRKVLLSDDDDDLETIDPSKRERTEDA